MSGVTSLAAFTPCVTMACLHSMLHGDHHPFHKPVSALDSQTSMGLHSPTLRTSCRVAAVSAVACLAVPHACPSHISTDCLMITITCSMCWSTHVTHRRVARAHSHTQEPQVNTVIAEQFRRVILCLVVGKTPQNALIDPRIE